MGLVCGDVDVLEEICKLVDKDFGYWKIFVWGLGWDMMMDMLKMVFV